MILGIDVSHHQGKVDHQKVAKSGMKFCIVKATEGVGYVDPRFEENIKDIHRVQGQGDTYYPGAYHFARPDSVGGSADGRAEANDFCDAIERVCGDVEENFLPPALDFEKYSESDEKDNIPWIEAFIETVEQRLGRRPMIYTGRNVWRYEVGNTDHFIDYALWLVYYTSRPAPIKAMKQLPWPKWTLWQYSGGGRYQHHPDVPGVGTVDVNRFDGSLEDLKVFASAKGDLALPTPSPTPEPHPFFDLEDVIGYSVYTARVQAMLLTHGYGPQGLVGSDGQPDGKAGPATKAAFVAFKKAMGLMQNTMVDWPTWWMFISRK